MSCQWVPPLSPTLFCHKFPAKSQEFGKCIWINQCSLHHKTTRVNNVRRKLSPLRLMELAVSSARRPNKQPIETRNVKNSIHKNRLRVIMTRNYPQKLPPFPIPMTLPTTTETNILPIQSKQMIPNVLMI